MTLTLDSAVGVSEDTVFRELDGQSVLLNLATGMYFGLDAVGTRIWQLAAENGSLRSIADRLTQEYDAERATLERDLIALAGQLVDKGLWTLR